ncbi:inorganic phosphate transporter 1-4-like [Capsicum galapagoense]
MLVFSMMIVFMFTLAIPYNQWTHPDNHIRFVVLYSLTFFFANFGPNTTTFFVPVEIFPARLQSTCHGISTVVGKLGAMVGAFGFLYLAQPQDKTKADAGYPAGIGVRILAVVNLLGTLCTFLVPESKGKSLEEKSKENDDSDEAGAEVDNHSSDTRTLPVK